MLYDPKWEQQTKTDPWSLASMIAWLETKDPKTSYRFHNCQGECLIGQFMAFNGMTWSDKNYDQISNRKVGPDTRMWEIAIDSPHTFGAALERARAVDRS